MKKKSLPTVRSLDEADVARARSFARSYGADLDLEARLAQREPFRWRGELAGDRSVLCIDDVSGIPFLVGVSGVERYQHRARVRARDGDVVAAVLEPTPGYEAYCQRMGLGHVEYLHAEPIGGPLAVAKACMEGATFEALVARAEDRGLAIHPYMGIETVWELAAKVAEGSGQLVEVIGPPPEVTWIANDKGAFTDLVVGVLGAEHVVATTPTREPDEIARHLVAHARRMPLVGLKRTRCASAMGNRVYDSSTVLALAPEEVRRLVDRFLEDTEWEGHEDVLVVDWELTDCSPSTQLWIPPLGSGDPVVDGVYEQLLQGATRIFLGSRPSSLPEALDDRLARASLLVGIALQELGYSGRCSFDFLVLGEVRASARVLFTECNGRWGGTSTPMHLIDRVIGRPRPNYRAQDFIREELKGADFRDLLATVGDAAYDPETGEGQYLFYNVGPLAGAGKLDVIALAPTREEADEALEERLPRILGL